MDKHIGQFCNGQGETAMGTDSMIWFDLRWGEVSRTRYAGDMRERYKKHFPHKYRAFTHYIFRGKIIRLG